MSRSRRGDNEPLGNTSQALIFVSGSALTPPKVTPEIIINLLQRLAGSGVCVFRQSRQSLLQRQFFPLSPCFPTFDAFSYLPSPALLISSTSTSTAAGGGEGRGGRGGGWGLRGSAARCPLCQMRSVDIAHQTGADQRPACAHAGRRIKPHHAQPPWQKKPLHPNKEIKSRVKSNSRGIVKRGPLRHAPHLTGSLCVCDAFVSFVAR